ncbi:hypothetical protein GCM10023156_16340 [Novipirellula rosea]|uniref:Uncharacterized protein n=1 Tax=Novipirellula rosea TaxID=1031540 RepID=A0ABP8MJZ7_9BACT
MFSVSLHCVGGFPVGDTPDASGPRHCGQAGSRSLAELETPTKAVNAKVAEAIKWIDFTTTVPKIEKRSGKSASP